MLSEKEKQHIYLEETFRREVRSQFADKDPKEPKRKRVMAFLNTPFFLWLLSTVVIGFGTFLYTRWENKREGERRKYEQQEIAKSANAQTIHRLDAEISSRLTDFAAATNHAFKVSDRSSRLRKALAALDRPSESENPVSVFPEYANRSLRSLLWELLQLVPESEKKNIKSAFDRSKSMFEIYLTHDPTANLSNLDVRRVQVPTPENLETSLDVFSIQLDFDLERWGRPLESLGGIRVIREKGHG